MFIITNIQHTIIFLLIYFIENIIYNKSVLYLSFIMHITLSQQITQERTKVNSLHFITSFVRGSEMHMMTKCPLDNLTTENKNTIATLIPIGNDTPENKEMVEKQKKYISQCIDLHIGQHPECKPLTIQNFKIGHEMLCISKTKGMQLLMTCPKKQDITEGIILAEGSEIVKHEEFGSKSNQMQDWILMKHFKENPECQNNTI